MSGWTAYKETVKQKKKNSWNLVIKEARPLKMTQRLKEIYRELNKLRRLGTNGRKKFLKTCSKDCVIKICECVRNVLNARLPIKPTHLKKLSRHKQTLRILAAKRTSLIKRKRILQKGGFIGALLPALIPALANLVGGLFNNNG